MVSLSFNACFWRQRWAVHGYQRVPRHICPEEAETWLVIAAT